MKIKEFIEYIKGRSDSTQKAYKQTLWQLYEFIEDKEPTEEEIRAFLQYYTTSSFHRHKAAIKAYMLWRDLPCKLSPYEFPKVNRKIPVALTGEEYGKLLAACKTEEENMVVETLFVSGMRIGEFMRITRESIKSTGIVVVTKGGKEQLKTALPAFLHKLQAYAQNQDGLVFPHTYSYYYNMTKAIGKRAGIEGIHPHILRHTRAVDLLNKDLKLPYLQQFLGHKRIETTMIYTQITGGELLKALEKAEE